MKYFICIFSLIFFTNSNDTKKKSVMNNQQKIIYGLDIDISTPFNIYINDISVLKYTREGKLSTYIPINDLLIDNETQTIKIELTKRSSKDFLAKDLYKYFKVDLVTTFDMISFVKVETFDIPKDINNKNFISHLFFFKIETTLFEIRDWTKSTILLEGNQKKILEEVKRFYNNIFEILNNGDYNSYKKLISKREEDVLKAYHNSEIIKEEQSETEGRVRNAKGKMTPIDFSKYKMKIYGNGRLVTLENEEGESPLYYSTDEYDDFFGIILHRPTPNSPLEVIR